MSGMTHAELVALMLPGDVIDLAELLRRPPWMRQAACKGQTAEFHACATTEHARAICDACPVVDECLLYALDDPTLPGMWGGTTEKERKALRRVAA